MFNNTTNISLLERNLIDEHIKKENSQLSFEKPPGFDWLLSDWNDDIWLLIGWDGSRTDPEKINWAQLLPNGDSLLEDKYSYILERTKRVIALMRSGKYASATRSSTQVTTALYCFSLIRWMVLKGYSESPYIHLTYEILTTDDYEIFCSQIEYGIPGVESFFERIKDYMDDLSSSGVASILKPNGMVDRNILGHKLNIEPHRLSIPRIDVLLRKYESCNKYPKFNITKNKKRREHISNRDETIVTLAANPASETVVNELLNIWELLYTHSHSTDGLLSFNPLRDTNRSSILSEINYVEKGRTPNIPMDIALHYISESITWIIEYGAELIELNNNVNYEMDKLKKNKTSRDDYFAPNAFKNVDIPEALQPLNITRYNRHQTGTPREVTRNNLSIKDALECLEAACFIAIATFSARRYEEITNLTINCIKKDYDGFVIEFAAQKASAHHLLESLKRPIPSIVLMAVNLLEELHKGLRSKTDIKEYNKLLFLKKTQNGINKLTNTDITNKLDLFADIIKSPTFFLPNDDTERRWYIRPHECRRFYAYTYVWSTPDSNLYALSYFMGHGGIEETQRYANNAIAGSEFPDHIKILTVNALLSDKAKGDANKLKEITLKHFNVENIQFIDEMLLGPYLQKLYESNQLFVEIINTPETFSGKNICIHYTEMANE